MDDLKYLFDFLVKKNVINKHEFDDFVEETKQKEQRQTEEDSEKNWESVNKLLDSGRNIRGELGL